MAKRHRSRLIRAVADRLDVVAVRVEDERAVVVRVVDLANAGPAVVAAAGRERGCMEGVHRLAILGRERHVHAAVRAAVPPPDPEEREVVAEPATSGTGSISTLIPSGARALS